MNKFITLIIILISATVFCQGNGILNRLQALENNGKTWYNIDGYSVTSEDFDYAFNEKGIKKVLRKHDLKDAMGINDDNIKANNIHIIESQNIDKELTHYNSYYIVENASKKITVIWFAKTNNNISATEQEVTNLIIKNKIPKENFAPMKFGKINFGGREIDLGDSCYWTALNTVQCPYLGEMNYSVHKDLDDARNTVESQLKLTKKSNKAKVVSEETVDVTFENIPSKAIKVVYDFTGITGVLAGMSGGKTLTVYYVAQNVRGNAMSCVMSFWNNDEINPDTKLPPLLEKVMKLK